MARTWSQLLIWTLALIVGGSLVGCGGDEHKDHKNHETKSGDGK
jgi:hypothetical protein